MSSESFDKLYDVIDKSLIPPGKYYSAHRNEEVLELKSDHSGIEICPMLNVSESSETVPEVALRTVKYDEPELTMCPSLIDAHNCWLTNR